jgi:hypothetical protein
MFRGAVVARQRHGPLSRTRPGGICWTPRVVQLVVLLWLASMLASCAQTSSTTSAASTPAATCIPTDQDQYVYDPGRLQVLQACIRVTGRIDATWFATDGDSNFLLHLDSPYQGLLTAGNLGGEERGDLGVEAVCTLSPVDPIVMALCASDRDPYAGPHPLIGAHVWVEGRYILDLNHESHAELHPLYRMGTLSS